MAKQIKRSIGARLNEKGLEILDTVAKTLHIKPRRPVSQDEQFRRWMHAESARAAREGEDTYEEFTDFGVDDDFELPPDSPYELVYDPLSGKEVLPAEKIWLDKKREEWTVAERKKREADKAKKAEADRIADYVTKAQNSNTAPKSKKAPKPQMDDPE